MGDSKDKNHIVKNISQITSSKDSLSNTDSLYKMNPALTVKSKNIPVKLEFNNERIALEDKNEF